MDAAQGYEFTWPEHPWTPGQALPGNHEWRKLLPLQVQRIQEHAGLVWWGDIRGQGRSRFRPYRLVDTTAGNPVTLGKFPDDRYCIVIRMAPANDVLLQVTGTTLKTEPKLELLSLAGNYMAEMQWPLDKKLHANAVAKEAKIQLMKHDFMHYTQTVTLIGKSGRMNPGRYGPQPLAHLPQKPTRNSSNDAWFRRPIAERTF